MPRQPPCPPNRSAGDRGRQDLGAVGCIRQDGGHVDAHQGQAAVDDAHEHAREYARAGNLAREAGIVRHAKLADIRGNDDAERERRQQIHGLVTREEARHERGGAE